MTGNLNSKHLPRADRRALKRRVSWLCLCGMALACALPTGAIADDLKLSGDLRLSGTVKSITPDGLVELSSTLSPEPLTIHADAIENVRFSDSDSPSQVPGALLELTNGDLLPVVVDALNETEIEVQMADAGPLKIPRSVLKSLQFGVTSRKIAYTGPQSLEEWNLSTDGQNVQDGQDGWGFAAKSLVANGPAYASRRVDAPRQFTLKFTLKWQADPNFQIYFADPLTPDAERVDRYYLQFNAAGMEIKREASEGKRFQSVILLARTPDLYPTSELDLEIRVDRNASRVHLLINGEPEGAGVDPSGSAPSGNGIMLVNAAPPGGTQEISRIEVSELDNSRTRHRSEDRGDVSMDSLISRDDDRWGGQLLSIRKAQDSAVFRFKSDFQEAPLELLEADVSTIFFAGEAAAPASQEPEHAFVLRLQGEGALQVTSCHFSAEGITAQHPLLGPLTIKRSGVAALERVKKIAAKPKSNE